MAPASHILHLSFDFTGKINNRLPTVCVGLSLTSITFMILTSQIGLYFRKASAHGRDSLWIKGIIIFIWAMQALDVALACHMTIVAHGNNFMLTAEQVQKCLWEWVAFTGTSAMTQCLVHAYFISRVYLLETSALHTRISMLLCIVLILEGSFGFVFILSFILSSVKRSRHVNLSWAMPVWLGFSLLTDISIAGSLYHILQKNSPYSTMSLSMLVKRLTRFCIQTGLITGLATGITVALWIVAQLDVGHLLMCFPTGAVYATCFMANLLARESYFHHLQVNEHSECFEMVTGISFVTQKDLQESVDQD